MLGLHPLREALARLGATFPDPFRPEQGSRLHSGLEAFFCSDLRLRGPFRGTFGSRRVWGFEPRHVPPRQSDAKCVELGDYDGGNYTVFVWDATKPDAEVFVFDHEDYDEQLRQPRECQRLAPSLVAFLAGLDSELPARAESSLILSETTLQVGEQLFEIELAAGRLAVGTLKQVIVFEPAENGWHEVVRLDGTALQGCWFDGHTLVAQASERHPGGPGLMTIRRGADGQWSSPCRLHLNTARVVLAGDTLVASVEGGFAAFAWCDDRWLACGTLPFADCVAIAGDEVVRAVDGSLHFHTRRADGFRSEPDFESIELPGNERPITAVAFDGRTVAASDRFDVSDVSAGELTGRKRSPSGCAWVATRDEHGVWGPAQRIQPAPTLDGGFFGGNLCTSGPLLGVSDGSGWIFSKDEQGTWTQRLLFPGANQLSIEGLRVASMRATATSVALHDLSPAILKPVPISRVPPCTIRRVRGDRLALHSFGRLIVGDDSGCVAVGTQSSLHGPETLCFYAPDNDGPRAEGLLKLDQQVDCVVKAGDLVVAVTRPRGFQSPRQLCTFERVGGRWQPTRHLQLDHAQPFYGISVFGDRLFAVAQAGGGARLFAWQRERTELQPWFEADLPDHTYAIMSSAHGLLTVSLRAIALYGVGSNGLGAMLAERTVNGAHAVLHGGHVIVGTENVVQVLSPTLQELSKLPGARALGDAIVSNGDLLVIASSTAGSDAAPRGELRVYRADAQGDGHFELEHVVPEFSQGIPGYPPAGVAVLGQHVIVGYDKRFEGRGCLQITALNEATRV